MEYEERLIEIVSEADMSCGESDGDEDLHDADDDDDDERTQ